VPAVARAQKEVGHAKLRERGIDLIAADNPGSFIDAHANCQAGVLRSRLAGHVTPLLELADVVSQFQAAPFIPKPSGFWVSHSK
jgi:hypothetical protein